MMKMGYDIDETSMREDIFRYLNFGIHIEKIEDGEGSMKRYLKEIVEFLPNGEVLTVFRCDLTNKGFEYMPGKVSSIFMNRMMEKRVDIQLQSKVKDGWGYMKFRKKKLYSLEEIRAMSIAFGQPLQKENMQNSF